MQEVKLKYWDIKVILPNLYFLLFWVVTTLIIKLTLTCIFANVG